MKKTFTTAALLSLLVVVCAVTDPQDLEALQALYGALNSPPQLLGWTYGGGDPCGERSWVGVYCFNESVTSIVISGLGVGGSLGLKLSDFRSLKELDVSNNSIGGQIPETLPKNATLINLACNKFTMNLPFSLPTLKFLGHLNLSHNSLSGPIGNVFSGLGHLKEMDLSFNNFSGDLPSSFSLLTHLHGLYLQENQFTGSVTFLSNLPLVILNLENNHFSGYIPGPIFSILRLNIKGNNFNIQLALPPGYDSSNISHPPEGQAYAPSHGSMNDYLNTKTRVLDRSVHKRSLSRSGKAGVISSVCLVVVVGSLALMQLRRCRQGRLKRSKSTDNALYALPISTLSDEDFVSQQTISTIARGFTSVRDKMAMTRWKSRSIRACDPVPSTIYFASDLQIATKDFSDENLLGKGPLGAVYRAELPDGQIFAVKMIKMVELAIYEEDKFLDVMHNLSLLRHPNIMTIRGYCMDQGKRAIIYDFLRNASLHDMIHSTGHTQKFLPWEIRLKIAHGVARALLYLHSTCTPPVAHENLKTTNILLDDEYVPHLTDCGLSALRLSIDMEGKASEVSYFNPGYTAPETYRTGEDKTRGDIFSFGVVLLELLTGRKAFDSARAVDEQNLVNWASSRLHDFASLEAMVDPSIRGTFSSRALSQFADISLLCIRGQPEFRPPMTEIEDMLAQLL